MSGGRQRAKCPQRFAPAIIISLSTLADVIVCFRGPGNVILSNVPWLHERQDCSPDIWPDYGKGSNSYTSASILAEFLLNHRQIEQEDIVAELLRQSVPEFTAEFIDVMPDQGGIIPISMIGEWLDRHMASSRLPLQVISGQQQDDDHFDWDDWDDVTAIPFGRFGFICSRSDENLPVYNIRQRIWFRPRLRMDWRGSALAGLTLAANMIDQYVWS